MILELIKLIVSVMIGIFLIACIFFIIGCIMFLAMCIGMIIDGIISSDVGGVCMGIFTLGVTGFVLLIFFTISRMLLDILRGLNK